MPAEDLKKLAARVYGTLNQALSSGDLSALDAILDKGALDHSPAPGQGPGLQGIKKSFAELRASFPDLQFTVEDMIAEGDKVACRITTQGTHKGAFLGVSPTGKSVTMKGIDILRFAAGKVVDRWGEFDTLGLLEQLGAAPKP